MITLGVFRERENAIHWAVRTGAVDWQKRLLDEGQEFDEIDHDGNTPFHVAGFCTKEEAAGYRIDCGPDSKTLGWFGWNVLHCAANGGSLGLIKYLLERGQDIAQTDSQGNNALQIAAIFGRKDAGRYLTDRGADSKRLGQKNWQKCSLFCSKRKKAVGLIKLELGKDMDQVDREDNTVLHITAIFGREGTRR